MALEGNLGCRSGFARRSTVQQREFGGLRHGFTRRCRMEVSVWWVVAASFVGFWAGFFLFAAFTIAHKGEEDEKYLTPGASVRTLT
jgi:hypothetical protein